MNFKVLNVFYIIICFLVLGCEEHKSSIEKLKYKINEALNQLNYNESNPDLQKSPMHLFALNSNIRTNRIISELNKKNIDTTYILNNLKLLKKELITHSVNDTLKNVYKNLLTVKKIRSIKRSKFELENKVLEANFLFINDMLNAITKIQNNTKELPYIIPLNNEIIGNEAMEAFIIVPDPKNSKFVFLHPDSLKYDSRRNHFIYLSGNPKGMKDSILIKAIIKNSELQDEEIVLKAYYNIIRSN